VNALALKPRPYRVSETEIHIDGHLGGQAFRTDVKIGKDVQVEERSQMKTALCQDLQLSGEMMKTNLPSMSMALPTISAVQKKLQTRPDGGGFNHKLAGGVAFEQAGRWVNGEGCELQIGNRRCVNSSTNSPSRRVRGSRFGG